MSLFSNDMRVANTASPSFTSEANVGQFGWTGSDQGHYNQLIQYVDECRKIWLNLEEKILFIEELLEEVTGIDAQVKYVEQMTAHVVKLAGETKTFRDQTASMYNEMKPLLDDFFPKYEDAAQKYADVVKMHSETEQAANAAAQSEANAAKSAKDAADTAEELRKGQVYRGTWNIQANNGYPAAPDTNSVWDIVLNEGVTEFKFDNTTWFWGDRLLYLKDDNKFTQIESGSTVISVNGKGGAVTLTAEDLGAVKKSGDLLTGPILFSDNHKAIEAVGNDLKITANQGKVVIAAPQNPVAVVSGVEGILYHTNNKPTPNEIGALSKTGDTSTGRFYVDTGPTAEPQLGIKRDGRAMFFADNGDRMGFYTGSVPDKPNAWLGYREITSGNMFLGDGRASLKTQGLDTTFTYNNNNVYHAGFKPTATDVGALPATNPRATGTLSIHAPSSHLKFIESDQADKTWHMEVSNGMFRVVESNVKSHIDIGAGGNIALGSPTAVKSTLQVGPSATGSNLGSTTIRNQMTSLVEVISPADTEHKAGSGIVFHNASSGTAGLVYKQNGQNDSYFNFISDETRWDVRVNNNKVYHEGFKPTADDIGAIPKQGDSIIAGSLEISKDLTVEGRSTFQKNPGGIWISTVSGEAGRDQVVSGSLSGGATIGSHNNLLDNWKPLYINTYAGSKDNYPDAPVVMGNPIRQLSISNDAGVSTAVQYRVVSKGTRTGAPNWWLAPHTLRFMDGVDLMLAATNGLRSNPDWAFMSRFKFSVRIEVHAPTANVWSHKYGFDIYNYQTTNASGQSYIVPHQFDCHAGAFAQANVVKQLVPSSENGGMPYFELRFPTELDVQHEPSLEVNLTIIAENIFE